MTVQFRRADEVPPKADTPPRRGPGRPKGSGGGRRPRNLRKGIDGLIVVLNEIIGAVRPIDKLDAVEIATLGKAIEEQAKASPRFRRALESILSVSGGTSLIPVVGIIAARRLSRHHMVPAAVDPIGSIALQMMQAEPSEAAAAMNSITDMMRGVREGANDNANGATSAAES